MEQTESSETSAYKIQTPGNYAEENVKNYILTMKWYFRIETGGITYS
jgi:hypothetical protein